MLRTRLLAAATATLLALGFAVGGASPALATPPPPPPVPSGVTVLYDNGVTCNGSGYTKPAALDNLPESGSGSFTPVAPDNWGTLAWNASTKTVTWTINAGWDVDICVKGGSVWPIAFIDTSAYTGVSYGHPQGLSHLGYRIISRPALEATAAIDLTDPTCESDQSLDEEGFDYTNSSYVIVDDGSEDGTFEVVFTADEGYEFSDGETTQTYTGTLVGAIKGEICEEEPGLASAGIDLSDPTCELGQSLDEEGFDYTNSSYVIVDDGSEDGTFEVVFTADEGYEFEGGLAEVTFADTLGGPSDGEECEEEPGIATAEVALTDPNCFFGQSLDEEGFDYTNSSYVIVDDGSEDGTFEVVFTADEGYEFEGGLAEVTFADTLGGPSDGEECVLPITDAFLAFSEPTCLEPEALDEEGFEFDSELAELTSVEVDGLDYTVVFTAIGENTQFFQSSEEVEGRVVSEGGTVLTFTGTLDGPDTLQCIVVDASFSLPPATCELGEDWENPIIDADSGVTWGEPVFDEEEQTVSIEFLATGANLFAVEVDGETTYVKSLTITLPVGAPDVEECELAVAGIAVTEPNCFLDSALDTDNFTAEDATFEIVSYDPETREYEVVFTADYGYRFSGELEGVSDDGTTRTFSGVLDAALEGEDCVLPITDAFLAFTEPTCLEPEALDEESFEFDSELAELTSVEVDGLDYRVVFTVIGENTQFFQSSEEVEGRVVSEGGTVLTFTGTLDGPNTELCPQIVIPDPVIVDDCLTQSYTISSAEGVSWTRSVDGGDPVPVVFGDGQGSVTFDADPFQKVVITASADEGYTMPEQYGPFEYTFAFDEECLPTAPVTTASVSWTQPDCLGNPGSYRLTNEPGVIWTVDGVVVAGNTAYSAPAGSTPSIVASLEPASEEFPTGFGWSDPGQRTIWNLVFAAAADCLPTLALTGASNALGGLGIAAIVLIMAGTGLVLARRRDEARVQS